MTQQSPTPPPDFDPPPAPGYGPPPPAGQDPQGPPHYGPPGYGPPGYGATGYGPPGYGTLPPFGYGPPPTGQAAGLATGALVCGLVGLLLWPVSVVGLVLGIVAIRRAGRQPWRYGGEGRAITGIVTGAIGVCILLFALTSLLISIAMVRSFSGAGRMSAWATTSHTLQFVGTALQAYAQTHKGRLPTTLQTLQSAGLVSPSMLHSSLAPQAGTTCDFWYLPDLDPGNDPGDWIVVYGDPAWSGGTGAEVLRLDGTAEFLPEPQFSTELKRCGREYQHDRGSPPQIVAPQ